MASSAYLGSETGSETPWPLERVHALLRLTTVSAAATGKAHAAAATTKRAANAALLPVLRARDAMVPRFLLELIRGAKEKEKGEREEKKKGKSGAAKNAALCYRDGEREKK